MASTANKSRSSVRSSRKKKAKTMTKIEMVQKMLSDQKVIREAVQKGVSLKELEKTHDFKFATLPPVKD
jgi:hypothetical protein